MKNGLSFLTILFYRSGMAQTEEGALLVAAQKIGISPAAYRAKVGRGLKWCHLCREWHKRGAFGKDRSRFDGLSAVCLEGRNERQRRRYNPKGRTSKLGVRFKPIRSGDKAQARHRVNHLVQTGRLPTPNSLPCFDCGHIGDDKRHEYDHYLGYAEEYHEAVQVVCTSCHSKRTWKQRKARQNGCKK